MLFKNYWLFLEQVTASLFVQTSSLLLLILLFNIYLYLFKKVLNLGSHTLITMSESSTTVKRTRGLSKIYVFLKGIDAK